MSRIFISHSSRDNAAAVALADWLRANGWDDLFLDLDPERGIAAGERWERALHDAADRCEAIVFLVSRKWVASDWCGREFDLAQKLSKRLFGVLIDDLTIADIPPRFTATWQFADLRSGEDHEIFRAVVPPEDREVHVTFSKRGLSRLRQGLMRAGLDARFFAWPPAGEPDRQPYRGLSPLEAADAGIFYGREAPMVAAIDALRDLAGRGAPRLFVVQGASGAGKSSFLRAGLLPRLSRDDRMFRPLRPLRPSRAVMTGEAGLVEALLGAFGAAGIAAGRADIKALLADPAALGARLAELARAARMPAMPGEAPTRPPVIVIPVDQAEELFQADGAEEAAQFLALVGDLARADHVYDIVGERVALRVLVLFTIRTDAYGPLQSAPALTGMKQTVFSLGPMPKGSYETVIEGPARRRTAETKKPLTIEPALTAALLADVEEGGGRDTLPLLAFTLERLFREVGTRGAITLKDYRELGSLPGAIEAAVARAFEAADADPRVPREREARLALLRRGLIPWLAGIDPATKEPRRKVARLSEIPEEARPLIGHLIDARLLATDVSPASGEATVEPAHEALLRQWAMMAGWLAEDLDLLSALEGVLQAARDWDANGRDPAWLAHMAGRLEDAEQLLLRPDLIVAEVTEAERRRAAVGAKLGPEERAYLAACRAADTARRDRELLVAQRLAEEASLRAAAEADRAEEATRRAAAETRARRRMLVGLSASVVAFLLASGAGFYAYEQRATALVARDRADAATTRAEAALRDATAAANALVFDLAQRFQYSGVPGRTIQAILVEARALQDRLAANFTDDVDLSRSRAVALGALGDLYARLETLAIAGAALEESLGISRALAARSPENTQWQRDLSVSLTRIGDVRLRAGDAVGALSAFDEGLGISRALAASDPANTEWQRDVSVILSRIGDVRLQAGDAAGALAAYEEGLGIGRDLADLDPENAEWQRIVSGSLDRIGGVRLRAGDADAALATYDESLGIRRAFAARDLDNTEWQRDIAVSLSGIGDVRLRAGDAAGALTAYEEGLGIGRALAARDPENTEWQRGVLASLSRIGDLRLRAGDAVGALAAYEELLGISRALVARDPENTKWQSGLSASLDRIGDIRLRSGDVDGALASYDEGLGIRRALASLDSENSEWRVGLSASLYRVGDVRLRSGDPVGALAAYEEAIGIDRALAARDPENIEWQRNVSVSLARIGDMRLQSGDAFGALAAYEEMLGISRALVVRDPQNTEWRSDVSASLDRIGDIRLRVGDAAGALAAHDEGLDIRRSLVARDPTNAEWQRNVSVSLSNIGNVRLQAGDPAGAVAAYEEGVGIRRALAGRDAGNVEWQLDVIADLYRISIAASDTARKILALDEAIAILESLRSAGRLTSEQAAWPRALRAERDRLADDAPPAESSANPAN